MKVELSRSAALDGLRGYGALFVVFCHALLLDPHMALAVLPAHFGELTSISDMAGKVALILFDGHGAVLLFFVLSGFVLRKSLERRARLTPSTVIDFAVKRIFRIYPGLFAAILIGFGLSWVWIGLRLPLWDTGGFARFADPLLAAKNAALLEITVNGASWTLQVELFAVPFILFTYICSKFAGVVGTVLVIAFPIAAITYPILVLQLPNLSMSLLPIVSGVLAADPRLARPNLVSGPVLWALLCGFIACGEILPIDTAIGTIAQTALGVALVYGIQNASSGSLFVKCLTSRAAQILGRVSYSFYLLNVPLLWVGLIVLQSTPLANLPSLLRGLIIGLGVASATLPLAIIVERRVERPGVRLGNLLIEQLKKARLLFIFRVYDSVKQPRS